MIIVRNRELLIPQAEQYIGTTYDENADNRQFLIDRVTPGGVDLANLVFTLDIEYSNGVKNSVAMTKEIQDEKVVLTWPITSSQLQITGTSFINLRAVNNVDGLVKWASFKAPVYIEDTIYTPGSYTGDLTELEQLEAACALIVNQEALRVSAENARVSAENDRAAAEILREQGEADRWADYELAEAARDAVLDAAIDDFNNDRSELKTYHDEAVGAAADAETYKDICETYAGVVIPIFNVDFDDGELKYNDTASFTFTVNTSSGDLEYTYLLA